MNNIYEKNHAKKDFEKPFINPLSPIFTMQINWLVSV